MSIEYNVINNEKLGQFEIHEGDSIAFMEYRFHNKKIALMHTEVPESLEGKGLAPALAEYAFKYAKDNNFPVMVYCPYVNVYLKRHPELREQLANLKI